MDRVIFVKLGIPDVSPLPGFEEHTDLLSTAHKFRTHVVLAFCAADVTKDASVGGIFNDVAPVDGAWRLELAVELPDLLPSIDERSEAVVSVQGPTGSMHELCLSNRISRFHFQDGPEACHALVPRTEPWHGLAHVKGDSGAALPAAEEQLRTVASVRFIIHGDSAEHAFESSIKKCVESLATCVNIALDATRGCNAAMQPASRSMRWDNMQLVYVLMSGVGEPKGARLAIDGGKVVLYPIFLEGDQATLFRSIADGSRPLDDIDRLLGEARSSWEAGEYEFAFLQSVIAAEIMTHRVVISECMKRGVSKKRVEDNRREMTYSWALNVGLRVCFDSGNLPKPELIAAMDGARKKRNKLMHEASFDMSRQQVRQLLSRTSDYVAALKSMSQL